jgi:hypothetical protein
MDDEAMGLEGFCSRIGDAGFAVGFAGDATRAGVIGNDALGSELARDRVPKDNWLAKKKNTRARWGI